MSKLSELLHLLLCQSTHSYDMMKINNRTVGVCYYYLEEQIVSEDSNVDHRTWETISEKFKGSLQFNSDEEALKFIRSVLSLSQNMSTLVGNNKERLSFVMQLLT